MIRLPGTCLPVGGDQRRGVCPGDEGGAVAPMVSLGGDLGELDDVFVMIADRDFSQPFRCDRFGVRSWPTADGDRSLGAPERQAVNRARSYA